MGPWLGFGELLLHFFTECFADEAIVLSEVEEDVLVVGHVQDELVDVEERVDKDHDLKNRYFG